MVGDTVNTLLLPNLSVYSSLEEALVARRWDMELDIITLTTYTDTAVLRK